MDHKAKGLFLVLLMSVVWAILIILSKAILNKGVPVFTYLFQMICLAAVLVSLYAFLFHRDKIVAPNRSQVKYLIMIGATGTALANIIGYYGLESSSSINYGFLVKTTVVFTVILAHFMLKEVLDFHKILLVIMLLVGVYLITTEGRELIPNRYDILIVMSAFFYAFANNLSKIVLRNFDPAVLSMYRMIFGSVLLAVFVIAVQKEFYVVQYPLEIALASLHMAMLMILIYRTLRITSVSYLSMMSMSTPVIVTILGVVFLNEHFSLIQALGGILIILSGVFIHLKNI